VASGYAGAFYQFIIGWMDIGVLCNLTKAHVFGKVGGDWQN
jgi:hypothetical protein